MHRPRRKVVPKQSTVEGGGCGTTVTHAPHPADDSEHGRRRRMSWSKLLARVFAVDVLACPSCGSELQRIELCTTAARILEVLSTTGPPAAVHSVA